MAFRNFRVNVISRVIILCLTLLAINLTLIKHLYAASAILAALLIIEILMLIRYLEGTNRRLARLFESIQYGDFSANFGGDPAGRSFAELNRAFNTVMERFRELSAEKEEHYRYLQSVVRHVGIGVIVFRTDGEVELINSAAKSIFDLPALRNIDALSDFNPDLPEILREMEAGQSRVVKTAGGGNPAQLIVHASELRLKQRTLKLVTVQNIRAELEAKEMEAWQNLIRVLTHEIRNSLTPISSLASSVERMLEDADNDTDEEAAENAEDIQLALQTIKKRSEGLLRFTDAYRSLTSIRKPEFKRFRVEELFSRVEKLSSDRVGEAGIEFSTSVEPPELELTADIELVEQVLINLILNGIEALEGNDQGSVKISSFIDSRNRVVIQVEDNGRGISADAREKIFIPFFSTRKDGSGIGLSLSRQIMRLHNGELAAESAEGGPTVLSMRF